MITIEDYEFDEFIEKGKVVIDFYADWCGPCQKLGPIFEKLSKEYKNIKFGKINIDSAREIAERFDVMSIPCIIFFKDGQEVDRIVGFSGEDYLKEKLDSF